MGVCPPWDTHTVGLYDLYEYTDDTGAYLYPGYVMTVEVASSIPLLDILYLQQVYRNAHGARPHN